MKRILPFFRVIFVFLIALGVSNIAAAQTYKCVINGTPTYSQTPCPAGTPQQTLYLKETASSQEQVAAHANVVREQKEIKHMVSDRHQLETKRDREISANVKRTAAVKSKCDALHMRAKWAQEDMKNASPKSAGKAKRKLERANEKANLSCADH